MKADSTLILPCLLAGVMLMSACEGEKSGGNKVEVINQLDIPVRVVWKTSVIETRSSYRTVEPGNSTFISPYTVRSEPDFQVVIIRANGVEKTFYVNEPWVLVLTDDNFP